MNGSAQGEEPHGMGVTVEVEVNVAVGGGLLVRVRVTVYVGVTVTQRPHGFKSEHVEPHADRSQICWLTHSPLLQQAGGIGVVVGVPGVGVDVGVGGGAGWKRFCASALTTESAGHSRVGAGSVVMPKPPTATANGKFASDVL